jgi:nucleoside-diphosphate-sugar epimerase
MKIAILGATSAIAKDLILSFSDEHKLELYSRRISDVTTWMLQNNLRNFTSQDYTEFKHARDIDVIINFVGAGSPEKVIKMGEQIFEITETFDRMALDYIGKYRDCKYIFISSGAVFGDNFNIPADIDKYSAFPLNDLQPKHYYGYAKAMAEVRHRITDRNIFDLRVFNYFSPNVNINYRFMITDMIRAIKEKTVYKVDRTPIVRDYVGPLDFYQMINVLMKHDKMNSAVDMYSRQPITKDSLLTHMAQRYKLEYETVGAQVGLPATGVKEKYYSVNTAAYALGYRPTLSSLENIFLAVDKILK